MKVEPKNTANRSAQDGDMEQYIKAAADSIKTLRRDDVYRVLVESNREELRPSIANYIKAERPDLVEEVDNVLNEEKGVIEDVGEVISGARKEQWKARTLNLSDMAGMNDREMVKFVKKDQIFPKPDYQAIADGFNETKKDLLDRLKVDVRQDVREMDIGAGVAMLSKKIRDSIQNPEASWSREQYADYIQAVDMVRDVMLNTERFGSGHEFLSNVFGPDILTPNSWTRLNRDSANYRFVKMLGSKFEQVANTDKHDFVKAIMEANKKGFPGKQEVWQRQYTVRSRDELKIGAGHKYVDGKPVRMYFLNFPEQPLISSFPTMKEAEAAINAFAPFMLIGTKTGRILDRRFDTRETAAEAARDLYKEKNPSVSRKDPTPELRSVVRTGVDYRGGRDVTADDLVKHFGFRGVQFGNWTHQKDRQQSINHAFDGFLDLAGVLKVPPSALSLNGELGIAFGARGNGAHAAHYESLQVVINLTKTSGAGSIAHEWGHAADDFMGRISGDMKPGMPFVSHGVSRRSALPAELVKSLDNVMTILAYRGKTKDEERDELIKKLEKSGRNIDSWIKGMRGDMRAIQADSKHDAEFNRIGDLIRAGHDNSEVDYGALVALVKQSEGRLPDKYYRDGLSGSLFHRDMNQKRLDGLESGEIEPGRTTSEFVRLSVARGEYWGRKHEMFARCFESFVLDKIIESGNRSDYLVHPAKRDKGVTDPLWPYPAGDERASINSAMAELVEAMRPTLQANLDLNKPWSLLSEPTIEERSTTTPVVVRDMPQRFVQADGNGVGEELPTGFSQAEQAAREQGFDPCKADRKDGIYIGKVVAVTDNYVIQDMGMHLAVLHDRSEVAQDKAFKVGDVVDFRYQNGKVAVKEQKSERSHAVRR